MRTATSPWGKTLLLDSRGCTAYSVDRLIAAVGVRDLIIVQAGKSRSARLCLRRSG